MGLFKRKAADGSSAEAATAKVEALRRAWEEHMERMPPSASERREFLEYRAAAAEADVLASRYIGAVITGHAGGLHAPTPAAGLRAELTALEPANEAESREVAFHAGEIRAVETLLDQAAALHRQAGGV